MGKPAWNRKEHPTIVCEGCGKPFQIKPYRLGKTKYCSRNCKKIGDRERINAVNERRTDLWTPEEIDFLMLNFPIVSTESLCISLPRHPLQSIRDKANELELKKTKEYRLAYLKENRQNAIAALTGSTPWNKQEPIHKQCETCGKAFIVTQVREDARFCSQQCVATWLKTTAGETHWHYRRVDRTCQWCKETFKAKPASVAYGYALFCSRRCQGSYMTYTIGGRRSSLEVAVEQVLTILEEPFESQKQIGPWLVDFYLPTRNLVLECDGKYWHSLPASIKRDKQKNGWLKKHGYQILRLGEDSIKADAMEAVKQGLHLATPLNISL